VGSWEPIAAPAAAGTEQKSWLNQSLLLWCKPDTENSITTDRRRPTPTPPLSAKKRRAPA
jgi:hypothetical protein